MIISIHQPNFFPYEGIVEKARSSDIFVVLTHAQFSKGNYHNRFCLDGKWYTMSVDKTVESLAVKQYTNPQKDWEAIKRRLPKYMDVLRTFDYAISESLTSTNVEILRRVFAKLDVKAEVVLDYQTELTATARLIDLCKHYGAKTYLSGPSGPNYLDMYEFDRHGIEVKVHHSKGRRAAVEMLHDI